MIDQHQAQIAWCNIASRPVFFDGEMVNLDFLKFMWFQRSGCPAISFMMKTYRREVDFLGKACSTELASSICGVAAMILPMMIKTETNTWSRAAIDLETLCEPLRSFGVGDPER